MSVSPASGGVSAVLLMGCPAAFLWWPPQDDDVNTCREVAAWLGAHDGIMPQEYKNAVADQGAEYALARRFGKIQQKY